MNQEIINIINNTQIYSRSTSEWKEYKLKDLTSKIGSGATPRGGSNSYIEEGISLFRSQNILDFKFSESGLAFIDDNQADELKNVIVAENDILLNITGDSVARCCIAPVKHLPARVNQHVSIIRTIPGKADFRFVFYYLQYLKPELLISAEIGATRNAITKGMIEEIDISLPELPEQHAIASILSCIDDKIDLLHRQNATLEAMGETLFRQWFVEEAKEDWEEVSLKNYISIKHGYAFKGNYISTEPSNLILVTPGNFKIGGGFKFDKFKYYTNEEFPKEYIFKSGDLIVTMTDLSVDGNTLGYPAFVPENYSNELYLHNQRVGKVEFKNEIGKYFLHQLMKTDDYQWFVLGGASGTAIRHTSPTSICNYSFRLPPKSKILEFETFANGLEEKNKKNQIQIRTLTALRDTLLPKLMSGEVRVEI